MKKKGRENERLAMEVRHLKNAVKKIHSDHKKYEKKIKHQGRENERLAAKIMHLQKKTHSHKKKKKLKKQQKKRNNY